MSTEFTCGIRLSRQLYENTVEGRTLAYRMVVRVEEAYNVDPNIFLKQRLQGALGPDTEVDQFVGMCGPVDIEEYPVGAPVEGGTYFRTADVDLIARSCSQLEDVWRLLCIDRDALVETLSTMERATGTEESEFGNMGSGSSSDSSEGSDSSESSEAPAELSPFDHEDIRVSESNHPTFVEDTVLSAEEGSSSESADAIVQVFADDGGTMRVTLTTAADAPRRYLIEEYVDGEWETVGEGDAGDDSFIWFGERYTIGFVGE